MAEPPAVRASRLPKNPAVARRARPQRGGRPRGEQRKRTLGALAALYHSRGLGAEFWAWILPHGVTALGAVVACGAAGIVFGTALIFPGTRSRLDSLARHGPRAGLMVVGAVGALFLAALIEGFSANSSTTSRRGGPWPR